MPNFKNYIIINSQFFNCYNSTGQAYGLLSHFYVAVTVQTVATQLPYIVPNIPAILPLMRNPVAMTKTSDYIHRPTLV